MAIEVVELCQVSPSEGAAYEQFLPLLHFDIVRLQNHLLKFLTFHSIQISESHFLDTVVPNLKNSLSLALKLFLPLAGKIVFPLKNSGMPVCHYVAGDSVSLAVARSDADFVHLTGSRLRDVDALHDLVPQTLSATYNSDFIKFSVVTVQVTLFPDKGICIGLTIHHSICDGATFFSFLPAWASINRFNGDVDLAALGDKVLPFYDRSVVQDDNKLIATKVWNHMKMSKPRVSSIISLPTNKIRAKFILSNIEIQKLKNFALSKKPDMIHVSANVVICSHVWSCLAKSAAAAGEEVGDNETEYITCSANCRARLRPSLPQNYFGNCVVLLVAETTHGTLKGNDGFIAAAQSIGEAIHNINNKNGGVFNDLDDRLKLAGKRLLTIAGSPRFDLYEADYGWGKPEIFEYGTTDSDGSVFLGKARDGGVEIILSMSKAKIHTFAAIFSQGLIEATQSIYI